MNPYDPKQVALRDHIAVEAMKALLQGGFAKLEFDRTFNGGTGPVNPTNVLAIRSYTIADSMMKAREGMAG